jgi:hypothetical protein
MHPIRRSRQAASLAAAAMLASPAAFAADSASVDITAKVLGVCKLTTTSYAMAFADMDPSASGSPDGTGSATVKYRCTKGTAPSSFSVGGATVGSTGYSSSSSAAATAGGDLKGNLVANSDRLPYKITWTTPTTAGDGLGGTAIDIVLNGTITYANYSSVTADTYTGSVSVSIAP